MTNTTNHDDLEIPAALKRTSSKPVMLTTQDTEKAKDDVAKAANETGQKVSIRHAISDKVMSVACHSERP